MNKRAFEVTFQLLTEAGFKATLHEYDRMAFGSWWVELSSRPPLRVVWDGKDGWLIIQEKTDEVFNNEPVWKDLEVIKEPELQNAEHAVSLVVSSTIRTQPLDEAWNKLSYLFHTDDGSLPEIHIKELQPHDVMTVKLKLEELANEITGHPEHHVVLNGINIAGTEIPPLGLFHTESEIILDYRMGPEWNPATLRSLLELLREIRAIAPNARFELEELAVPEVKKQFVDAIERYLANES